MLINSIVLDYRENYYMKVFTKQYISFYNFFEISSC